MPAKDHMCSSHVVPHRRARGEGGKEGNASKGSHVVPQRRAGGGGGGGGED